MHRLEPIDAPLGGFGQIVIGVVHIDVLGIAATRRQIDREQRRRLGRRRVIGMIGVERFARNHALAVHEDVVGDIIDVGMAGNVLLFPVVNLQLAEHLRGGFELARIEVLVRA